MISSLRRSTTSLSTRGTACGRESCMAVVCQQRTSRVRAARWARLARCSTSEVADLRVSRIGLGTWQFGSREWGYGEAYASEVRSGAPAPRDGARDHDGRHRRGVRPRALGADHRRRAREGCRRTNAPASSWRPSSCRSLPPSRSLPGRPPGAGAASGSMRPRRVIRPLPNPFRVDRGE